MINVLMIEDDLELANILTEFLSEFDIEVTNYDSPYKALIKLNSNKFDLIILDLTLPDIDGLELCKKIREKSDIPIIISSARTDIADKLLALKFGADDYMPKPYDPRELEARITNTIRRNKNIKKASEEDNLKITKSVFKVIPDEHVIKFYNNPIKLTKAEYEILSYMIKNLNYAVSRENIIKSSISINDDSSDKSIDVIISRIRNKLNEDSKNPKHIHSIRGIGYKLTL